MVHQCESEEEFNQTVQSGTVIVDFTATWCGPCKAIAPLFEEFSKTYTSIKFIKVDVDELDTVSAAAGVSAMPSFYIYKDGVVVDKMVGASRDKLKDLIEKYSS